jgi:adenosylcobinamide-GDP ribazoletransferase
VVGYAAGWAAYGTFLLTHSQLWCAITAFALMVLLTGAIHIDGFLDCCDALLASTTLERRLEILRDPHHGTYAIVGMALLAIVLLACLYELPPAAMPVILAYVGLLSRAATLLEIGLYQHARTGDRHPNLIIIGFAWGGIVLVVLDKLVGFSPTLVLPAYAIAAIWAWLLSRRLGGRLTGDAYGAIIVITEVGLLKLFALYPWLVQ